MEKPIHLKRIMLNQILNSLYKGKVIILYGARQIGKTTLTKELLKTNKNSRYISCDELDVQTKLKPLSHEYLYKFFGKHKLIVLDEAQKIENIGVILKIMNDFYPKIQIVATGSSSFDLANKVGEPLVGRSREFQMSPLTLLEILSLNKSIFKKDTISQIKERIIYGNYPEVYIENENKEIILNGFVKSSLYKDVLEYRGIKKPLILVDLLKLLALQIGNEVSYNEIANALNVDRATVESYITLLEQAFIIFRLRPYSNNERSDIKRLKKIYFWDTGIRNAVIGDFSDIEKRKDKGALFENYFISELQKKYIYENKNVELYFWRSKRGNEIDLVEINMQSKTYKLYECKYKNTDAIVPTEWTNNFGLSEFSVVNIENIKDLLI